MQTLRKQYIEYRREKQSPITMDNHAHAHHHKHMYFCLFNCLFVYLRLLSVIVVQQKLYFRTSRHFRRWGGQNAHTRKKKKKKKLYFRADKYRWYCDHKYEKANQNYIQTKKN